jgi:hypothetical protein
MNIDGGGKEGKGKIRKENKKTKKKKRADWFN